MSFIDWKKPLRFDFVSLWYLLCCVYYDLFFKKESDEVDEIKNYRLLPHAKYEILTLLTNLYIQKIGFFLS